MSLTIAGTGHRPDKLGGYTDEVYSRLVSFAERALTKYDPIEIISGMALGWDLALAQAALNQYRNLIVALPFEGQEAKWPRESQNLYFDILMQASQVKVVCKGGYSPAKMMFRNKWMVDRADLMLALWNGSKGGTSNCVEYANKTFVPVVNLWKEWVNE